MKVLCSRERLREAFSVVTSALPMKSTKPVLQSVRIEARKGRVELSATDLEVGVRFGVDEAQVETEGVVVLPSAAGDFIRDLADETVTLLSEGANCHIRGLSDACQLVGADPEEFPRIPEFEEKDAVEIPAAEFAEMARRTSFAAAREMGRYAMNGILLELGAETARMVATDGRRLALAEKGIGRGPKSPVAAIVPAKGVQQVLRSLDPGADAVGLSVSPGQIAFRTSRAQVFVRLLEGEFPKYSAVLPKECPSSVEFDRAKMYQKLQLVANLTADDSRSVRWTFLGESIQLTAASAGRGEARAELEAKVKLKGPPGAQISFNPDYILDGLKASVAEVVHLEFGDRDRPGKFLLGENYVYVVMPITLE